MRLLTCFGVFCLRFHLTNSYLSSTTVHRCQMQETTGQFNWSCQHSLLDVKLDMSSILIKFLCIQHLPDALLTAVSGS